MYKRFLLVLSTATLLAGCVSAERGPYSAITREDGQPHQLTHGVTMLDMNVRNSFLLVSHSAARAPGGQIQARVTMQNIFKDTDLWADVRFVFYNPNGEPVDVGAWQTVYFPPMDLVMVEGNSMRGDAQQFNAQFRNLRSRDGRELCYPDKIYEHGYWKDGVMPQ